jgi:WD40 repeat protein
MDEQVDVSDSGWQLSKTLSGHSSDVKCIVLSADNKMMVTGSRDNCARVWTSQDGTEFVFLLLLFYIFCSYSTSEPATLQCPTFVNSIALYSCQENNVNWILAGINNGRLFVFDAISYKHLFTLNAHQSNGTFELLLLLE